MQMEEEFEQKQLTLKSLDKQIREKMQEIDEKLSQLDRKIKILENAIRR